MINILMDMRRNKYSVITGSVLLIIILIGCLIRYNNLNEQYQPPTYENYKQNQVVSYNSFAIKASEFEVMNEEDIQDLGPVYEDVTTIDGSSIKSIVTEVRIKNPSSQQMKLEVYPFVIESGGYSNGIDADLFHVLNKDEATMIPVLDAGEEITLQLPFTMIESQFTDKDWDNIENREFNLVLSLYPVKKTISSNI